MKFIKILLPMILVCSFTSPSLANPCSSLATLKPSLETRNFQNRELSFKIPANFRIIATQSGLMIHSPWSYEVYTCQIKSKYGSGELENGILVYTLPFDKSSHVLEDLTGEGYYGTPIETNYPNTSAKMYVYGTAEGAEARIVFIKKTRLVVIQTPMDVDEQGKPLNQVHDLYKPTIDLLISTINLK